MSLRGSSVPRTTRISCISLRGCLLRRMPAAAERDAVVDGRGAVATRGIGDLEALQRPTAYRSSSAVLEPQPPPRESLLPPAPRKRGPLVDQLLPAG